jgi:hypothetical protein
MQSGVRLKLLIGTVPMPAPPWVIEALSSANIHMGNGETPSGFELTFDLPQRSPLRTLFLLTGGGGMPLMRVVLIVQIGAHAESVIDGVTTHVETQPGEGGVSKLVVKGKDMSAVMDLIDFTGLPYPAMSLDIRVLALLAKYATFGVIPKVMPCVVTDLPVPTERIPVQRGTDYDYVKLLALRCGYVFYFEPGPVARTSVAYWGPEIRIGEPQPALSVNMDGLTNVEGLTFQFDKEKKTMPVVYRQESISKATLGIPIPDVTPLNPPLGLVPPLPIKLKYLENAAHLSWPSALMAGIAYAGQNSDSVSGSGTLDVGRYGRLLKSRQLVGVRGAGLPFNGLYYVTSVTHDIKRGEYKQSFTLSRNALVSTVPRVSV